MTRSAWNIFRTRHTKGNGHLRKALRVAGLTNDDENDFRLKNPMGRALDNRQGKVARVFFD